MLTKILAKKLEAIFKHVKKELAKKGKTAKQIYGLTNLDEFLAEANSNVNFQYELARIKYKNETAWGAFTRTIANLLGVANVSALTLLGLGADPLPTVLILSTFAGNTQ